MNSWSPLGVQGIEEKRNLPSGVSSEATWRVYFVRTVSPVPKYTLRVASELTPSRVCYAFLQYLVLQGGLGIHRFGHFGPKWRKSAQKGGTPCFDQFFSKVPAARPCCRRNLKKSGEIPPRRMVQRGDLATFFQISATGWGGCPGSS